MPLPADPQLLARHGYIWVGPWWDATDVVSPNGSGGLKRDQGAVLGPLSAQHSNAGARPFFSQLDIPCRIAHLDLSLALVTEMSGKLEIAAHHYGTHAVDERLSRRDRARARLWVGTALSKNGHHDYATRVMQTATRDFEDLQKADDWSVAHQKLALARRGSGDLAGALHLIVIARNSGITDSPMQRVRLDTAHGHILLSGAATRDDGHLVLDLATRTAAQYGLVQVRRPVLAMHERGRTALRGRAPEDPLDVELWHLLARGEGDRRRDRPQLVHAQDAANPGARERTGARAGSGAVRAD